MTTWVTEDENVPGDSTELAPPMSGHGFSVRGNSLQLPLPNECVDLIVTSPPYFALRSYRDEGEHYTGQVGSEPTPGEFVDALIEATREMARVLKPSGSIWVNLGDKYAGSGGHNNASLGPHREDFGEGRGPATKGSGPTGKTSIMRDRAHAKARDAMAEIQASRRNAPNSYNQSTDIRSHGDDKSSQGIPPKSLMLLPHRYAIRCIDELGLTLRAEVIWAKPNGLPESVTDRVRRNHEVWWHMTKGPQYYTAVDEIREPGAHEVVDMGDYMLQPVETPPRKGLTYEERKAAGYAWDDWQGKSMGDKGDNPGTMAMNALGRIPNSVWTVATEPLSIPQWAIDKYKLPTHYAAFPTEWVRKIVLGWSPPAICTKCGEGRRPAVQYSEEYVRYRREVGDFNAANRVPEGGYDMSKGFRTPEDATVFRAAPEFSGRQREESSHVLNPTGGTENVKEAGFRGVPEQGAHIIGYVCACTPYTDGDVPRALDLPARNIIARENESPIYSASKRAEAQGYLEGGKAKSTGRLMAWRTWHFDEWQPAPTKQAVVLDPFGGTGTTAMIARALGRTGVSLDLSMDYCRLSRWRVHESGHWNNAVQRTYNRKIDVERPKTGPARTIDQLPLL